MNKEKEIAQELFDNDYSYLVRKQDGLLYAYILRPYKDDDTNEWCSSFDATNFCIDWNNKQSVYQWQHGDGDDELKLTNSQNLFKFVNCEKELAIYEYLENC